MKGLLLDSWRSIRRLARWLSLLGVDPLRIIQLRDMPWFIRSFHTWRRLGGQVDRLYPVLADHRGAAGAAGGHYFHQDYWVARAVFNNSPDRHVDVGSRIDGFVAHVAVFREIEVLDIRPLRSTVTNIKCRQANLIELPSDLHGYCDSLSCLHALEHFGLGRYGDPLDPIGHLKGFRKLVDLLRPSGRLYLSFPIGRSRVEFNAHRVFHPNEVTTWAGCEFLDLEEFVYVDDAGELQTRLKPDDPGLTAMEYGCGIYVFRKKRELGLKLPGHAGIELEMSAVTA